MTTTQKIKEGFGERVKSLGLGFSGSQFDFLWEYVEHHLLKQRQELIKEIEGMKKFHKEFECKYGHYEDFCENQDCPNAPKEYNKAIDDVIILLTQSKGWKKC